MNILFIMTDTLRADYLGCYGNSWIKTPNIDRLAAEGTMFTNCYAEGQPTLQSRRALMTGRRTFPWKDDRVIPGDRLNLQPGWQPINEDYSTISEILRVNGFFTGFVSDVPQYPKPGMNYHRGFDTWDFVRIHAADSNFAPLDLYPDLRKERVSDWDARRSRRNGYKHYHRTLRAEDEVLAGRTLRIGADWLMGHRQVENWFLWVDTFDPHEPFLPPPAYQDLYSKEELLSEPYEISEDSGSQSEDSIAKTRSLYAGEVTKLDYWVGYLLQALERSGRAGETIVVFHSDHGVPLGHGGHMHKSGRSMYQCQSRNPLIVRHPSGLGAGKAIGALCYNMDIMPTLLEFAGREIPEEVEAMSLAPLMRDETESIRSCVTSGYNAWAMYRDESYLMTQHFDGSDVLLHDLKKDPREERNIAKGNKELVRKLRTALEKECGSLPEPQPHWTWPPAPESEAMFPRLFWPK